MSVRPSNTAETLLDNFVKAFESSDIQKLQNIFDDDIIMYVTNADAGVDQVVGKNDLLTRFQSVDYSKASLLKLDLTQIVTIEPNKVLGMVHVNASKHGIDFENFSAFLCYTNQQKITHIWMVDAKPTISDTFWKSGK